MKMSDLKKLYGEEYPLAVTTDGIRLPLSRETRFARIYASDGRKMQYEISRFMDESASITVSELRREWPEWTEKIRSDFCQSCDWLNKQADFPGMLRFIMQQGTPDHWSAIALSVASQLPGDEAFDFLVQALRSSQANPSANLTQAIARTKHPDAEATLRRHLAGLWAHPALWQNDDFVNWVAFDATTCIAHLIEQGALPADFSEQARRLSEHVCKGNRGSCLNFLAKHYSWMKPERGG